VMIGQDWDILSSQEPARLRSPLLSDLLSRGVGEDDRPIDAAPPSDSRSPRPHLQTEYVAPGNRIEEKLTDLWSEELRISPIGIHDNFFDLGGDSLIGVRIVHRIQKEWAAEIAPVVLYEAPTVSALAKILGGHDDGAALAESKARARRRRARTSRRVGQGAKA
jgi:acyl carrier protein